MRKLFWSCAAAGLAALGLWKTAGYALHHPDSLAAYCIAGVYHAAMCINPLAGAESVARSDADDVVEIPLDPEPVAAESCLADANAIKEYYGANSGRVPVVTAELFYPDKEVGSVSGTFADNKSRGRLPGKIIIDDGEELPIEPPDGLTPEPNLNRFVARIEAQWKSDDTAPGTGVTTAFWQTTGEYVRPMPYCTDDDETPDMPPAEDPQPTPRKKEPPRIWNPFMPKGTEVGGDKELSPDGNDCLEDPSTSLQIPGCLNPVKRESKKVPVTADEEASEPAAPQNKQSRPIEAPKTKRSFDESKLQPFAAPVKVDTMDFRPSDWGKRDVALPPF